MYPNHTTQDIPYGYCKCGCGHKTSIAKRNDPAKGWVKGQPVQYIQNHLGKQFTPTQSPNPSGLCMCGCGQTTTIAAKSNSAMGNVKGQPRRFVQGHGGRRPFEDRFWEKVDKRGPDECWLWNGGKRNDYGAIRKDDDAPQMPAHRASWELHYGPIPDGLYVCHNCPDGDRRACVNPAHLFLGTAADNTHDMFAKGRSPTGEKSHLSKLNATQVREIRERSATRIGYPILAREYGVTVSAICAIVKRRCWKHI